MNTSAKNTIIAVVCPDRGVDNDPEALGLALHPRFPVGQLTSLHTVGNMGVMICLGQGSLCSLSALFSFHLHVLCITLLGH